MRGVATMIRAIIFDLDNTLTDFMKMKRASIDAAVDGMLDAGLTLPREEVATRIYQVYDREGIEYQQVFDRFLNEQLGHIDYKILSSAIVAYRRARDGDTSGTVHSGADYDLNDIYELVAIVDRLNGRD